MPHWGSAGAPEPCYRSISTVLVVGGWVGLSCVPRIEVGRGDPREQKGAAGEQEGAAGFDFKPLRGPDPVAPHWGTAGGVKLLCVVLRRL